MRCRLPLAACLVLGVIFGTAAQPSLMLPEQGVPGPGGTRFNVSIANTTSSPVRFELRPRDGTWTEYALGPNDRRIYNCTGCGGTFEVRVATAGQAVTYDLRAGRAYQIRVNLERNIYDIYRAD